MMRNKNIKYLIMFWNSLKNMKLNIWSLFIYQPGKCLSILKTDLHNGAEVAADLGSPRSVAVQLRKPVANLGKNMKHLRGIELNVEC